MSAQLQDAVLSEPTLGEIALEQLISEACERLQSAANREDRHAHYLDMCRLIERRSPAAVERIERARGLRR